MPTTILGATKVTGKANGWTYGGLTALTDREYALVETRPAARRAAARAVHVVQRRPHAERLFRRLIECRRPATAVLREGDVDAYTGSIDYPLRWEQQQIPLEWPVERHAHAPSTASWRPALAASQTSITTASTLASSAHYDYFNSTFKNTDLGFFNNRNNRTQVNGGLDLRQPDPTEVVP